MPTTFKVTVENPDELLNAGSYGTAAVVRAQWSATEGGTYANLAGTASLWDGLGPTGAITAATRSYTGYDPAGTSSLWYRTRYENSGATRLSEWTDPFQTGDETAGYLCSLYDVQQELGRTTTANEDELILEKIRQVSRAIEHATGRWLAPRPTDPASTATYRFHTEAGSELHIPRGIRTITTLGIATEDQPSSGGTYVTATSTDYYIDPPASERFPEEAGRWIRFRSNPTGAITYFSDASFGAEIVGSFGPASVAPDIAGVATRAALRRFLGKGAAGTTVAIGPTGTEFVLPDLSGADRATIADYTRWRF